MSEDESPSPIWSRVDPPYDEYPPVREWVWTTDFEVMRKGRWHWDADVPLEEGRWEDEAGRSIEVMQWVFLEQCPDGPPAIPPRPRPMREILQELWREMGYGDFPDDPTVAADWWKK